MPTLKIDTEKSFGAFKLMNATNGGPCGTVSNAQAQNVSNFTDYQNARIPYSRNHDANICGTVYGGPYVHDISAIFPDFGADVDDPASYDFICTDADIAKALSAGTKTFYRLGASIEHQVKKHFVYPPKDFQKWSRICEHVIRHYTEGWADGFTYDMPYWEIWCEPDMMNDETDFNKKDMWAGSDEQFYDFYEIAAKHLKSCFPHLKIGGPGLCSRVPWADRFLCEMQKRNVPFDFFSYHCYANYPEKLVEKENQLREVYRKYGYGHIESILDEYNYIQAWTGPGFLYSVESHIREKGAAFVMACMTLSQQSTIDMLMVYDTRPSVYNNFFDYYTRRPIKGYYALYWYGMFYDMETEIRAENQIDDIYCLAGKDKNEKVSAIITHYNNDDATPEKEIKIDFGKPGSKYEIYAVDKDHNGELLKTTDDLTLRLPLYSFFLIKEI